MVDVQMRPSGRSRMDHLILMEFCSEGHTFDVVKTMKQRGEVSKLTTLQNCKLHVR